MRGPDREAVGTCADGLTTAIDRRGNAAVVRNCADRRLAGLKFASAEPDRAPIIADFVCRERNARRRSRRRPARGQRTRPSLATPSLACRTATGFCDFWNTDVLTNLDGVLTTHPRPTLESHQALVRLCGCPSPGLRFAQATLSPLRGTRETVPLQHDEHASLHQPRVAQFQPRSRPGCSISTTRSIRITCCGSRSMTASAIMSRIPQGHA